MTNDNCRAGRGRNACLALAACATALLYPEPLRAASVAVCPAEAAARSILEGPETYGPDGRLLRLAVSDASALPDECAALELPLPPSAVRWIALSDIPPDGPRPERLALQGFIDADRVSISEIIYPQSEQPGEPGFMPLNANMRPYLHARTFGVEERVRFDGSLLSCAAGTSSAGIVFTSAVQWEQVPGMELEITASGRGEFAIALADAERAQTENPLGIGTLQLSETSHAVRYPVPQNAQRWTQLSILCPAHASTLDLGALRLVTPPAATPVMGRATWLWSPQLWREAADAIWQLAQQEHLRKVYVSVPLGANGQVADEELLAAFIAEAKARGIAVWAVAGDRSDVLPQNLPTVVARADAYRRFNATHADTPLAGFQLDIEPYLLPGSSLAPDYWRERYVTTIDAVHAQLAGALPLDLVMPVWWGTHPAWGSRLLDALPSSGLSLTVMNYRTNVDALRDGATSFLAWGRARGQAISMALEKGSNGVNARDGADEIRATYGPASAGELWLLQLSGISVLLLLDGDYTGLPGQAYARTDTRTISTAAVSFASAPGSLDAIAATMEAEWSAWESFGGLAIHGLDQDLQGN